MKRNFSQHIKAWFSTPRRKPMILRGARQVGKTWIIRNFAKEEGLDLVELNFEKTPEIAGMFVSNNPGEIIANLNAHFGIDIKIHRTLLFLDEIQAAVSIFPTLRYFKEEMPELAVMATGSLLEFALEDHNFSMPVGRITYAYMEPMSFFEFLYAKGEDSLVKVLEKAEIKSTFPSALHIKCMQLLKEYMLIGGMPEVVSQWIETKDISLCQSIQRDLLATFYDDFNKYGNADVRNVQKVFRSVAEQLGNKFVLTRVASDLSAHNVKVIISLLNQAKVISKVFMTSASGLPLGASINEKYYKTLFLDTGLVSSQLGLRNISPEDLEDLVFGNKGALAEQYVGQQLRTAQSTYSAPELYYWQRSGGREGEIDYVIQLGAKIIPVEVKAGKAGAMKSLHQFMYDKKLDFAIRIDANPLSLQTVSVKTTQGDDVDYRLLSIPLYLVERIDELNTDE